MANTKERTEYQEIPKGWIRFQEPDGTETMVNILRWPWHIGAVKYTGGESWYLRCSEIGGVDLTGWTEDDAIQFIERYG